MLYRVVDTDNHGGDYPDEKFVGPPLPEEKCHKVAAIFNDFWCKGDHAARFYKVVTEDYKLQPGFEP